MDIYLYLPGFNEAVATAFGDREVNNRYSQFCSCEGRVISLLNAGMGLIGIVAGPVLMSITACQKASQGFGWKVLDVSLCILFTSLLSVIFMVRGLFGAIFHPGILYKANDVSSSDHPNPNYGQPNV